MIFIQLWGFLMPIKNGNYYKIIIYSGDYKS
jgi:hypothetical protein